MKTHLSTALTMFLAALALTAATLVFALPPSAAGEAPEVAQSTSAILENRAA